MLGSPDSSNFSFLPNYANIGKHTFDAGQQKNAPQCSSQQRNLCQKRGKGYPVSQLPNGHPRNNGKIPFEKEWMGIVRNGLMKGNSSFCQKKKKPLEQLRAYTRSLSSTVNRIHCVSPADRRHVAS